MKLALQLYTIRDCCKTGSQMLDALKAVRAMGYDGVEFAGYSGLSAAEIRNALDETGLTAIASHESVERLENCLDDIISYNQEIGSGNIVCAYSPAKDAADLKKLEEVLTTARGRAEKYGINVLYHNHSHEFNTVNGFRPIDDIIRFCMLEIDTYWVFNSKIDVPDFMYEHKNRIGLIHLKDGSTDGKPCAIGEGKNDIQSIINASEKIGAKWLIVENDDPLPDGLSDAGRSINNLKSIYHYS